MEAAQSLRPENRELSPFPGVVECWFYFRSRQFDSSSTEADAPAVPDFRYPQFCAVARAAEIVGERWTLLIMRELLFGQQRFSDLRRRLSQVSPSVLSDRLSYLEAAGLVTKSELEPPAASTVYELTEDGQAFGPALMALARWGMRFLLPPRHGEQLDVDRFLFVLSQYVRSGPSPALTCELRVSDPDKKNDVVVHLSGGENGTTVSERPEPSHVTLSGEPLDLVGILTGSVDADQAVAAGHVRIEGDLSQVARLPELFEIDLDIPSPVSPSPQTLNEGEGT